MRRWLHRLGHDVCVQQVVHSSILRVDIFLGGITNPELRSGELAKNSTKLPFRLVFRSHSSVETTIAASRPFFVIFCGPCFCARSITSLNLAFASATVHCVFAISLLDSLPPPGT